MRAPSTVSAALALLLPMAATACGDTPAFAGDPLAPLEGEAYRLTYSMGEDRAAAWLPGGDSLVYVAEGYAGIPRTPGVPLALDFQGGRARVLGAGLYAERERWVEAVVPSPDGSRLALLELVATSTGPTCAADDPADATFCSNAYEPRIDSMSLAVVSRETGAGTRVLGTGTGSRTLAQDAGGTRYVHVTRPFQAHYRSTAEVGATMSWAPAGDRLVVSDGTRLLVWHPETGAREPVPGTEHGMDPAWSPDGAWIAYTRVTTAPPATAACTCSDGKSTLPMERTVYPVTAVDLVIVRPDGSDARVVAPGGEDPAWGPDGRLYFRTDTGIRRVSLASGAAAEDVPGTLGGRGPAVSPDGAWLAFHRPAPGGGADDIWLVRLP